MREPFPRLTTQSPSTITSAWISVLSGAPTKAWKSACSVATCSTRTIPRTCTTTSTSSPARSSGPSSSASPRSFRSSCRLFVPDSIQCPQKGFCSPFSSASHCFVPAPAFSLKMRKARQASAERPGSRRPTSLIWSVSLIGIKIICRQGTTLPNRDRGG